MFVMLPNPNSSAKNKNLDCEKDKMMAHWLKCLENPC